MESGCLGTIFTFALLVSLAFSALSFVVDTDQWQSEQQHLPKQEVKAQLKNTPECHPLLFWE